MKNKIILIVLSILPLILYSQAFEAGKISPFTAHFLTTIQSQAVDSTIINKLKNRFLIKKINDEPFVNAFILLNENADLNVLRANGVKINIITPNIITAQVPVKNIEQIAMLPGVRNIQIGIPVHRKLDKARIATNVDQVQAGTNLSTPYMGKNVLIGIIDSGLEYGHIDFYDLTGTSLRIKRVWDQNTTGTPPGGFSYGKEYTTQAAILAAQFDNTTETHATHVTGIATGADKSNNNVYYGVAPEADIAFVSYNLNDQTTDNVSITDGLKYIYDYATSINEPCVVNMSLGSHIGPHDGTSAFDQLCDGLEGKGRLLVGAVGNEGGKDSLHLSQSFTSTNNTLKSFFSYNDSTKLFGLSDIWGTVNSTYSIRVIVYNKTTGAEVYTTPVFNAATSASKSFNLTTTNGAVGTIQVFTQIDPLNNKPNAFIASQMNSITPGNYVGVIITAQSGTVNAWADDFYSDFSGHKVSGWTTGNSTNSMGEIGGTGKQIISVGAYVSKTVFTNISGQSYRSNENLNSIASFSSTGPTIDGRTKPDITAPGSLLVSAYSSAIISDPHYSNYIIKRSTVNGNTFNYGQLEGTSMSTPMVTGILADWLEAKNDLSPDEVRTILKETSISDSFTGTIPAGGSNTWGYGKIDALNGIIASLKIEQLQKIQSSNANYLFYPNPTIGTITLLFGKDDSNVQFSVYSSNGQKVFTQQIGTVTVAQKVTVDLPNISTGVYLITVKGNLQYKTYHILKQ